MPAPLTPLLDALGLVTPSTMGGSRIFSLSAFFKQTAEPNGFPITLYESLVAGAEHDLKRTVGGRLRAAGLPLETRKVLLGHQSGDVTTRYSGPELEELIEAANRVCVDKSRKSPALVVLRKRAAGMGV